MNTATATPSVQSVTNELKRKELDVPCSPTQSKTSTTNKQAHAKNDEKSPNKPVAYRQSSILKRRRRASHDNGNRSRTRSLSPADQSTFGTTTCLRTLTRSKTRSLSPPNSVRGTATPHRRHRADSDSLVQSAVSGTLRLESVVTSVTAITGGRPYMEDRHTVVEGHLNVDGEYHFAGVYDGHGGQQAAEFAAKNLHVTLDKHIKGGSAKDIEHVKSSLRKSFLEIDKDFLKQAKAQGLRCGTTAVVSVVHSHDTTSKPSESNATPSKTPNGPSEGTSERLNSVGERKASTDSANSSGSVVTEKLEASQSEVGRSESGKDFVPATLAMAHVGDSRAVLCRNGRAIRLTNDHKPNDPIERQRVQNAGGKVTFLDTWRVHHENLPVALSCARALGDVILKEPYALLSADPDISVVDLSPDDSFIILASDGLWDVIDDQEAVDFVRAEIARASATSPRHLTSEKRKRMSESVGKEAAAKIVRQAVLRESTDNITAVVMSLSWRPDDSSA